MWFLHDQRNPHTVSGAQKNRHPSRQPRRSFNGRGVTARFIAGRDPVGLRGAFGKGGDGSGRRPTESAGRYLAFLRLEKESGNNIAEGRHERADHGSASEKAILDFAASRFHCKDAREPTRTILADVSSVGSRAALAEGVELVVKVDEQVTLYEECSKSDGNTCSTTPLGGRTVSSLNRVDQADHGTSDAGASDSAVLECFKGQSQAPFPRGPIAQATGNKE